MWPPPCSSTPPPVSSKTVSRPSLDEFLIWSIVSSRIRRKQHEFERRQSLFHSLTPILEPSQLSLIQFSRPTSSLRLHFFSPAETRWALVSSSHGWSRLSAANTPGMICPQHIVGRRYRLPCAIRQTRFAGWME